jgi:protein phosphatase 1G
VENGRINGGLNLTRSLGDFGYKSDKSLSYDEQLIICRPDVTVTNRSSHDEFILMGCDGIFDAFGTNNQGVADMVNGYLKETKSL